MQHIISDKGKSPRLSDFDESFDLSSLASISPSDRKHRPDEDLQMLSPSLDASLPEIAKTPPQPHPKQQSTDKHEPVVRLSAYQPNANTPLQRTPTSASNVGHTSLSSLEDPRIFATHLDNDLSDFLSGSDSNNEVKTGSEDGGFEEDWNGRTENPDNRTKTAKLQQSKQNPHPDLGAESFTDVLGFWQHRLNSDNEIDLPAGTAPRDTTVTVRDDEIRAKVAGIGKEVDAILGDNDDDYDDNGEESTLIADGDEDLDLGDSDEGLDQTLGDEEEQADDIVSHVARANRQAGKKSSAASERAQSGSISASKNRVTPAVFTDASLPVMVGSDKDFVGQPDQNSQQLSAKKSAEEATYFTPRTNASFKLRSQRRGFLTEMVNDQKRRSFKSMKKQTLLKEAEKTMFRPRLVSSASKQFKHLDDRRGKIPAHERFFESFMAKARKEKHRAKMEEKKREVKKIDKLPEKIQAASLKQHKIANQHARKKEQMQRAKLAAEMEQRNTPKMAKRSPLLACQSLERDVDKLFHEMWTKKYAQEAIDENSAISYSDASVLFQKMGFLRARSVRPPLSSSATANRKRVRTTPAGTFAKTPRWDSRNRSSPSSGSTSDPETAFVATEVQPSRLTVEMIEFLDPNGSGGVTVSALKRLVRTFSKYTFYRGNRLLNRSHELNATNGSVSDSSISNKQQGVVRSIFGSALTNDGNASEDNYFSDESFGLKGVSGTLDDSSLASPEQKVDSSSASSKSSAPLTGFRKELEMMRVNRLHFDRRSQKTKVLDGSVSDPESGSQRRRSAKKDPSPSFLARVDTMLHRRKQFEQKMEQERKAQEQEKLRGCTFKPDFFTRRARKTANASQDFRGAQSDSDISVAHTRVAALASSSVLAEGAKLLSKSNSKFKTGPLAGSVCEGTKKVSTDKRKAARLRRQAQNQARIDSLYQAHATKQQLREQQRLQKEQREQEKLAKYTFKPKINPPMSAAKRNASPVKLVPSIVKVQEAKSQKGTDQGKVKKPSQKPFKARPAPKGKQVKIKGFENSVERIRKAKGLTSPSMVTSKSDGSQPKWNKSPTKQSSNTVTSYTSLAALAAMDSASSLTAKFLEVTGPAEQALSTAPAEVGSGYADLYFKSLSPNRRDALNASVNAELASSIAGSLADEGVLDDSGEGDDDESEGDEDEADDQDRDVEDQQAEHNQDLKDGEQNDSVPAIPALEPFDDESDLGSPPQAKSTNTSASASPPADYLFDDAKLYSPEPLDQSLGGSPLQAQQVQTQLIAHSPPKPNSSQYNIAHEYSVQSTNLSGSSGQGTRSVGVGQSPMLGTHQPSVPVHTRSFSMPTMPEVAAMHNNHVSTGHNARAILHVDVQLTPTLSDRISVREGDVILNLAEQFAWKHGLAPSYTAVLEHMLITQLQATQPLTLPHVSGNLPVSAPGSASNSPNKLLPGHNANLGFSMNEVDLTPISPITNHFTQQNQQPANSANTFQQINQQLNYQLSQLQKLSQMGGLPG